MSDFAKNLRYYRKKEKLSQTELAKVLHYGYTAIANYESGRNEPSIDDLIRIATTLHLSLDELVGKYPSQKETHFLYTFLRLSERNQALILDLLDALPPEKKS